MGSSLATKWEYKTIQVKTGRAGPFIRGDLDSDALDQTLNVLGAEGWEMVSAFTLDTGGHSGSVVAVFKRAVQG